MDGEPSDARVLTDARQQARGARYADEAVALAEQAYTWRMVALVAAALAAVLGCGLVYAAVRPAPAYVTHLGRDGMYRPGELTGEDAELLAREFVGLISTLRPDAQAIDERVALASRMVHPRYAEGWLKAAAALRFEVLTADKTTVFDSLELRTVPKGTGWAVTVYGKRKRYVGDRRIEEGGYCYEVAVERVAPRADYPRPLSIASVAEPRECTDQDLPRPEDGGGRATKKEAGS